MKGSIIQQLIINQQRYLAATAQDSRTDWDHTLGLILGDGHEANVVPKFEGDKAGYYESLMLVNWVSYPVCGFFQMFLGNSFMVLLILLCHLAETESCDSYGPISPM